MNLQSTPDVLVRLFGEPMFVRNSQSIEVRGARRAVPLLVYLSTSKQQFVDRRQIAEALWPELDGDAALANLRRHLHALSSLLPTLSGGVAWLRTSRFSVGVEPTAADLIDVVRFERALRNGEDEAALSLYTDHLAPSVGGEWAMLERNRLAQLANEALDRLIAANYDSHATRALAWATRAHEIDPWRESVVRVQLELRTTLGDWTGARNVYRVFSRRLQKELDVTPSSETSSLYKRLASDAYINRPGNTPNWSQPLIGRDVQCAAVVDDLRDNRLVTIVGDGGVGKTRLACHVAELVPAQYIDGVQFIDLTSISDKSLVCRRISASLGFSFSEVTDEFGVFIADVGQRLIIVDNCEHVLEEAARAIAMLLQASPEARVIATSREPLRLRGEALNRLGGLSESFAIDLFVSQARLAGKQISQAPQTRRLLSSVVRKLDLNPLAIKLAAAQLVVLSVDELHDMLDSRLSLLNEKGVDVASHQRSLESSIRWSYDLLDPFQQRLFRMCGAFTGDFTLEAVSLALGIEQIDAAQGIRSLIEKSLLVSHSTPAPLFHMLELCRLFARSESSVLNEDDAIRRNMLRAIEALFARSYAAYASDPREALLATHNHFVGDVESIVPWAVQCDGDTLASAVRLLHALLLWHEFPVDTRLFSCAHAMLAKLERSQHELLARVWYIIAVRTDFADRDTEPAHRRHAEEQTLVFARLAANRNLIVDALIIRRCEISEERLEEAPNVIAEIESYAPLTESRQLMSKWKQGMVAYVRDELDEAARLLMEVLQSHRALGNSLRIRTVSLLLAECEQARGNTQIAIELVRESLVDSDAVSVHYRMGMAKLVAFQVASGNVVPAAVSALKLITHLRKAPPLAQFDSEFLIHVGAIGAHSGQHAESLALDGYFEARYGLPIHAHRTEATSREKLMLLSSLSFDTDRIDRTRAVGASWSRSEAFDAAERLLDRVLSAGAASRNQ